MLNEAPTINTALDFAEDDKVRTPDAAMTRQLIPDRPMHGAATKRQTRVAREEDRAEPGAEWLFSLPEGYPNCEEMLSQVYDMYAVMWMIWSHLLYCRHGNMPCCRRNGFSSTYNQTKNFHVIK